MGLSVDEYLRRAQVSLEKGDLAAAIIDLKNSLNADPKNIQARWLLGNTYLKLFNGRSAEKELRQFVALGGDHKSAAVPLARALLLQGNAQAVLQEFEVRPDMPPADQASLHVERGRAYAASDDVERAIPEFRAALTADKESVDAWLGQAYAAMLERQTKHAEEWIAKVLETQPDQADALALRGALALEERAYEDAEAAYQRAVDIAPLDVRHQIGLARAQVGAANWTGAAKTLDALLSIAPAWPEANYLRALCAYESADFAQAQTRAEKALESRPNDPSVQLLAGAAAYGAGKLEQAYRHLSRSVGAAPHNDVGRKLLAAVQLKLGLGKESAETLGPVSSMTKQDAELLAAVGRSLANGPDLSLAQRFLQTAVRLDPQRTALQTQLAATYLVAGESDKAIEALQQVLASAPNEEAPTVAFILASMKAKRFDDALQGARKLQDTHPESPNGHTLEGLVYVMQGQQVEAEAAFRQALTLRPGDPSASANLAVYAYRDGDFDAAKKLYEAVLAKHPDNLLALLGLAQVEVRTGQISQAINRLDAATRSHPGDLRPAIALGRLYLAVASPADTLRVIDTLLHAHPNQPDLLLVKARAQLEAGQPAAAKATLETLLAFQPTSPHAHFYLSKAHTALGDEKAAQEELNQSLALDPDYVPARIERVWALWSAGEADIAHAQMQALKRDRPLDLDVLGLEGKLAMAQGNAEQAVAIFEEGLQRSPENRAFVLSLAAAQMKAGQWHQGMATLSEWLKAHPNDVAVRFSLANEYLLAGRLAEAKAGFIKVVETQPNNVPALNNLAWLLREDQPEEAMRYALQATELAPDWPPAMDTLGTLLLSKGDTAGALRYLQAAAGEMPKDRNVQYRLAQATARSGESLRARGILETILADNQAFDERKNAELLLAALSGPAR